MKVAIFGRPFDKTIKEHILRFFDNLKHHHIKLLIHQDFYHFLIHEMDYKPFDARVFRKYHELDKDTDLMFSIGGDGTILDAITIVQDSGVPIVGINTGNLGFLASIAKDEIDHALEAIYAKNYILEERSLLKLKSPVTVFQDFPYGLNEIAVQKIDSTMIKVHVFIDDEFLNTYWADGLIVSTPTGSTAYSLSVGGPIIIPTSGNFIISPISPHNLTVRPIVLPDDSKLHLKLESRAVNFIASIDHRSVVINNTMDLKIEKADFKIRLLKLNTTSFYKTLRNKLMWGADKRN
ncbi:MAG: NAD kinase [Bacteroidales bacterium]|jgi:NAD+ kinase|nr:NAD kinase [Bacteroidales bacterium]